MPARILREEILNSEKYWSVCDEAKLLFIHLLISVDDTARFSGNNFTLRSRCFSGRGMEANRMEILLSELSDQDLIRLYDVNGERFVFIPKFKQRLRFFNSKYPDPPNEINDLVIKKTDLSKTQDSLKTDSSQQKRREEKRSEEKRSKAESKKATRFSLTQLPDEWILFCKEVRPDLEPKDVFESFKDYWISIPGQKGNKADWLATWRNWVRNEKKQFKPKIEVSNFDEMMRRAK
jgi:hypothetical protein